MAARIGSRTRRRVALDLATTGALVLSTLCVGVEDWLIVHGRIEGNNATLTLLSIASPLLLAAAIGMLAGSMRLYCKGQNEELKVLILANVVLVVFCVLWPLITV